MANRFSVSFIGLYIVLLGSFASAREFIHDVSQLSVGQVCKIAAPKTVEELQKIVQNTKHRIAIAGGRFSQGGHIWYNGGITIDMSNLNKICHLDVEHKTITVQTGATWQHIQKYIDPYNLSIRVMQSYNDFSVGGSLSVNVHSRTINDGALIETVQSIKILLANGSIVTASRSENYDLFTAAIGGYGAVGIIVEATLSLTDNEIIERQEVIMSLAQYGEYFTKMIRTNPDVVFHNADVHVNDFNKVSSVTWYKTTKPCTILDRLQINKLFTLDYVAFQVARYIPLIQKARHIQTLKHGNKIVWRNYEMGTSVVTVEPTSRMISTTILQEYFVPCDKLQEFVAGMHAIVQKYNINMMNVSLRYIHRDTESIMAYAQAEESFALVCYINMANNSFGIQKAQNWTQELINCAIGCGGTYYLPYQPYATKDQFTKVYPEYKKLLEIKKRVDPNSRFMNSFLKKYIS